MKTGKYVLIIIGAFFILLAGLYLFSPETIGGPTVQGEMIPQMMSGRTVNTEFTSIPLGIGELVVPIYSAVAIFSILGLVLLFVGLTMKTDKKGAK